MDASLKVLRSIGGAPNIHDRLTRYMITPHGGKLMMGQLILQHLFKAPAPSELRLSWGQIYVALRCQAIKAIGCTKGATD